MLKWVCFKVWIVHELDCITSISILVVCRFWRSLFWWHQRYDHHGFASSTLQSATDSKHLLQHHKIYETNLTFASPWIIIRFKQINQQDATVLQVYYLTFMCGSTCFGSLPAHRQEHTTVLGASGFTVGEKRLERCWSWSGRSLTFMCGSTCFGLLPAHHQENTTVLGASGFTVGEKRLERCWSWSDRLWPTRPRPTTLQPLLSNGKTRGS